MYHIGAYSIFVRKGKLTSGQEYVTELIRGEESYICFVVSVGVHDLVLTVSLATESH